jgi:hypothetical protein
MKRKGLEKDSLYSYQYQEDSQTVEFLLKDEQVATIGWGRNTHYKWLMQLKENADHSYDTLPPWINQFNLEKLWVTSADSQIYIREYMLDSLVKGKKKAETRLILSSEF